MFNNHANVSKNILYVTFQGKMDSEEIQKACENALAESKRLKPGFGTISDISSFVPTTEEGRMTMQNTMKALKDGGMKSVVRVVPSSAVVPAMQWQRTSRSAGYEATEAHTLPDAEALIIRMMQS